MAAQATAARKIEVAAALIWRGDRLLLSQRPADKPMPGFWEFPGGKLEPGETAAEALGRELEEELGITAQDISLYETATHHYAADNLTVTLHFLVVGGASGEPAAREGQTIAWLSPQEALELPLLAADVAILRRLAVSAA